MSGKLRIYKDKLEGYNKFYQIVKTIKMVSLAKFQQTIPRLKSRDQSVRYTEKCFNFEWEEEAVLKNAQKTLLYVPITSNRGSCGALNSNTFKYVASVLSKNTKLLAVGKKGNDSLSKLFPNELTYAIINDYKFPVGFNFASYVFENAQQQKDVERVQLIYNRYISAGMQRLACINIPPFEQWLERMNKAASTESGEGADKNNYMFANALLNNDETVIKDFYEFHGTLATLNAICENELSEYAARIVAVEGQLTNISSLRAKTLWVYNKTRQGSITAALIEILSAMNAMEGNAAKGVKRTNFWDGAKL